MASHYYKPEDTMRAGPLQQPLSDEDVTRMVGVRTLGQGFHDYLTGLGASRELSLAKTKIEEAVMWAVKHITA